MSSEVWIAILGVATSIGVAYLTSRANRPKVNAEAAAATVGGEVAKSTDARAWVQEFREQAKEAALRAEAAERRADAAEAEVAEVRRVAAEETADVRRELAKTNTKLNDCIDYVLTLQRQIRMTSEQPAEPPASLRPPL